MLCIILVEVDDKNMDPLEIEGVISALTYVKDGIDTLSPYNASIHTTYDDNYDDVIKNL